MTITSAPSIVEPDDLAAIEAIPLANRDLPISTYDAVLRAARRWPGRQALAVMPDGANWAGAVPLSYAELAGQVTRTANVLPALGVGRTGVVGLLSPNTAELIAAFLGDRPSRLLMLLPEPAAYSTSARVCKLESPRSANEHVGVTDSTAQSRGEDEHLRTVTLWITMCSDGDRTTRTPRALSNIARD
jgi:hypothetical protein